MDCKAKYLSIFSKFDFFDFIEEDYSSSDVCESVFDIDGLNDLAADFLADMALLFCLKDDIPNASELVDALIEEKNWVVFDN